MRDISIVTAFFDIGRGDWDSPHFQRSADVYFERFAHLATLENEMVIFTSQEYAARIKALRGDRPTTVIVVDYKNSYTELREKIAAIQKSPAYQNKISPDLKGNPEYWNPDYVLVTSLKATFLREAIERKLINNELAAWVDFGYCRSADKINSIRKWQYGFDKNKINYISLRPYAGQPIDDVITSNVVYICGGIIVAGLDLWPKLEAAVQKSLRELMDVGLVDDEQTLWLMAYLADPESFKIHPSSEANWLDLFKQFHNPEPEPASATYEISVNLATHNRAAFLEKCLVSLCEQTLDPSRYEICVVANACTDATPEVVKKIAAHYPRHRLFMVEESTPGLSRARNCGLKSTQAPLVANVDDDGTVYSDWLERFLLRFHEFGNDLAIVGGEIEPVWGAPRPDWITPKLQCFLSAGTGLGIEPRFLKEGEFSSEGNGCYRRSALQSAGNFPVELGRVGDCLLSGENVVETRIRKQGGRVFFDPDIVLKHYIHPERLTPLWSRQRFFWQGISGVAVRNYNIRHGIPVDNAIDIDLPLKAEDWQFINQDTADNIEQSVYHFQWLGYVLALTGIMPIENG